MTDKIELTRRQAARFLLCHHGLLGKRAYKGKKGVESFIRRMGCIQYDPVNVCGRSPELVLLSRVEGYDSRYLWELLYKDRRLYDYYDKCMCIVPSEDMKYFRRSRNRYASYERNFERIESIIPTALEAAREKDFVSASDIDGDGLTNWRWEGHWGSSSAANATLERLYFEGRLAVHHKEGAVRYYCLPEKVGVDKYLSQPDPNENDGDYFAWAIERRINSAGMLADRASDVLLGIAGLKAADRRAAIARLLDEGRIFPISVEKETYFAAAKDAELVSDVKKGKRRTSDRCELLAPLDNFMWDRRMIKSIFGFDYKWEIYTPKEQRKYGHYVLPVLFGDRLVGRIEPVADGKKRLLTVRNFWPEEWFEGGERFEKALEGALERLAALNGCERVERQ